MTSLGFRAVLHHSRKVRKFCVENEPDAEERRKYISAGSLTSDELLMQELNETL